MTRRGFLRGLLVAGIVIACGGSACVDYSSMGVQYAPGYGYVVHVREHSSLYTRYYYFVFETEEEARKFAEACGKTNCNILFSDYEYVSQEDDPDRYKDISSLVQSPPPIVHVAPVIEMPAPIPPMPQ